MNLKKLLRGILKGGDKGLDLAGTLGIPVVAQIDKLKDAIKDAATKNDAAKIHEAADALEELKPQLADTINKAVEFVPESGPMGSKKFMSASLGIVSIVAMVLGNAFGLDKDLAELAIYSVLGLVAAHQGAQGLVDTIKAKVGRNQPEA